MISGYTRESINEDSRTPSIMVTDLWTHENDVERALFDRTKAASEVELYYIDLAELHEFGEVSREFFDALANADNLDIFELEVVQRIIMFKWPIVKKSYVVNNFLPSLAFLVATTSYTSLLMHNSTYGDLGEYWITTLALEELMTVMAVAILLLELRQLLEQGAKEYCNDWLWNFIDVFPPIVIVLRTICELNGALTDLEDKPKVLDFFAVMMSLATLLQWFKILHFLRIFDSTGFLVRALIDVVFEMRYFMLIFFVLIMSFADAFKVMQLAE